MIKKIIFVLLIFAFACVESGRKTDLLVRNIKVEDFSEKFLIDSISFVPIKENKNFLLSQIDKLVIKDDMIFILDKTGSQSLLAFSKTGEFITKFGNIGQAMGEYIRLWDFDVDENYVYLLDRNQKKILFFDKKGIFIKEMKMPFRAVSFKILEDSSFLFSLTEEKKKSPLLVKTDMDFLKQEVLLYFDKDYKDIKATNGLLQSYDDGFIFHKPVNDSVYFLNRTGRVIYSYAFDFGKKKVPSILKKDYERLLTEKQEYFYFSETPLFVKNRYLIVDSYLDEYRGSFIYDFINNKSFMNLYLPEKINLYEIIFPLTIYDGNIVGWMDMEVYQNLKNKSIISKELVEHLESDGKTLIFYQIN